MRELNKEVARLRSENAWLKEQVFQGVKLSEGTAIAAYMETHGLSEFRISCEAIMRLEGEGAYRLERLIDIRSNDYIFGLTRR